MKLSSITLKNFRQYYGEHTINFATSDDRHVTVIHGDNGAGKTSLFTAINWCLYGDKFVEKNIGQIGELVNRRALAEGENVVTSVELRFTYQGMFPDREVEFCARRKIHRHLSVGETPYPRIETPFSLEIINFREFSDDEASDWISSIMPEDVSVHFFFDGEKINNFTRPERKKEVENAVRNVLKIEEVARGMKHLEDITGEYQREARKHASGKLKALLNEKAAKEASRDKLSDVIVSSQEELTLAKQQKREIDERLEDIKGLRMLVNKRKAIEAELEQFQHQKAEIQEKIRSLANQGFIALAKPAIDEALEILAEIQRGIPAGLLSDLLNEMRCLCGRPIDNRSPEFQTIRNLLNQSVSSDLGHVARETYDLNLLVQDRVGNLPTNLKLVLGKAEQLDRDIKAKETRLKNIRRELENLDHDEARALEERRKEYEAKIPKLEEVINETKGRILEINQGIAKQEQQISTETDSNAKAEELKRFWKLASDASTAMKTIYAIFSKEIREQVQVEVGQIFKRLVWNGDHFAHVRLSENYQLQVIDENGADVLPELSAGQRQVLSLAFIAAMAKVAVRKTIPQLKEEPFPIVMDTPFGRLSSEHRKNITVILPDIAKQLVLFVTDEELRPEAKANLKPRIGAEYELKFDPQTKTTTIEEI